MFEDKVSTSRKLFKSTSLAKRFPAVVTENKFDALEEEVLDYVLASATEVTSVCRDTDPLGLCEYWNKNW